MRLIPFIVILGLMFSCHPEDELETGELDGLKFSSGEIFFDTLFTATGSITKRLKVYNPHKKAVNISSIDLQGKATSPYTIIVNGLESNYISNLYLRGGDSILILISVTIDPINQALPFLVEDKIIFRTNGNMQEVLLLAYGQDANFLNEVTTACDTTWTNTKPFVISGHLRIAPGCTLKIDKGVRIYFRDNAVMEVKGTLLVEGTPDSMVTFSGDKFSAVHQELPGQWEGLVFDGSSKNNMINHARIKNARTGIRILNDPADSDTIAELRLSNTVIRNMQKAGVEAYGTDVIAFNTVISNCVRQAFAGLGGGNYYFRHCTFANYSFSFFREQAAIEFTNFSGPLTGPLKASIANSIVWGDRLNELQLQDNGTNAFDFSASRSIIRTTRTDLNVNGNLINTDPQFEKPVSGDFHLKTASPAINGGTPAGITKDLEGKLRDVDPDIGAFEE